MKRYGVLIGGAALLALACGSWLATCRLPGTCLSMAPALRWPFAMALADGALLGAITIAWLTRVAWILVSTAQLVERMPRAPAPADLSAGAVRAGARRVVCVSADAPLAFCHGGIRPSILVSTGLLGKLSPDELLAVLAHEQHHVERADPLRRTVQQGLADVIFWLPVLGWWADRRRESSELAADRAAIGRAGRSPLAGALWKLGSYVERRRTAAFSGAAELRVAQVLGDDIPGQRVPMSLWVASVAGGFIAVNTTWCIAHLFGSV